MSQHIIEQIERMENILADVKKLVSAGESAPKQAKVPAADVETMLEYVLNPSNQFPGFDPKFVDGVLLNYKKYKGLTELQLKSLTNVYNTLRKKK